ncbi:MAG TPA: 2Fe-2S iron-sulfur cluster-binding protein, partial [Noviherbaspirillum sp.]|nr:2Fe-2S iron-sulfur cluster-binding protein [Noviherbaspirillum sp.]
MNDAFTVRIDPAGWVFDAPQDATLLDAASRAGLRLPSSCRNGTCRACMCRMTSGQVRYRIAWPGLLPEEKAQGF